MVRESAEGSTASATSVTRLFFFFFFFFNTAERNSYTVKIAFFVVAETVKTPYLVLPFGV